MVVQGKAAGKLPLARIWFTVMSSARLSKTSSCAVSTLTVLTSRRTGLSRRQLKSTYFSSKVLAGAKSYRLVQFHGSSSDGSCQCGRKKRGEPNQMFHHDASVRRQASVGAYGVATARSLQNASSAAAALPGLPAMIAPLKAPMETPATISGWM